MKLAVVYEVRAVDAAKPGDPQQTLRQLALDALRQSEQRHRGARQLAVFDKPQARQNGLRRSGSGVRQASPLYGMFNRLANLADVQIVNRPARRDLVLPALVAVQPLYQHPIVLFGGHAPIGVSHAAIRDVLVRIRRHPPMPRRHFDNALLAFERDDVYRWERLRFDLLKLVAQPLDCGVARLLSQRFPVRRDSDEDAPAARVEHGAQRLGDLDALGGGLLELQRFGFAFGQETGYAFREHWADSWRFGCPRIL